MPTATPGVCVSSIDARIASQTRSKAAATKRTLTQNAAVSFDLIVLDDAAAAARRTGELLAETAHAGGHIALSGGTSPELAYRTAAHAEPDWSRVDLWWGDERCVPPDDESSNFGMAKRTLLDNIAVPPSAVHRIRGELDPSQAAAEYDTALDGVHLALNVLGIGPD